MFFTLQNTGWKTRIKYTYHPEKIENTSVKNRDPEKGREIPEKEREIPEKGVNFGLENPD